MILTASLEFDPRNNKEATTRPTDNVEVPQVTASCHVESRSGSVGWGGVGGAVVDKPANQCPEHALLPLPVAADPGAGEHQHQEEGAAVLLPLQPEGQGAGARPPGAHGSVGGDRRRFEEANQSLSDPPRCLAGRRARLQ